MIRPLLSPIQTRVLLPHPRSMVLGLLIVATLAMPVSYRAGSDETHAHTIFQGVVDLIAGYPHHHSEAEATHESTSADVIFSPMTMVLLITGPHVDLDEPLLEPDVPALLGLSVPISAFATINDLRILLMTLLATVMIGKVWPSLGNLSGIPAPVETPPPRSDA